MEHPGQKLKRARERLRLTYRDVEEASQRIAARRGSDEFAVALSRLADIENKGTVPTIYRFYTLCAIYRLDFHEVLRWYGAPIEELAADSLHVRIGPTHPLEIGSADGTVSIPVSLDFEIDTGKTTFLSQLIRRWGKAPLSLLKGLDVRQYRYAQIGLDDWSMHPILHPGALIAIDDERRKIAPGGWTSELDRPIYFLEHRGGYSCGWCTLLDGRLLVQPHPSSHQPPEMFEYPREVDVVGQVVGVAMLLDSKKRRPVRAAATPVKSPNP